MKSYKSFLLLILVFAVALSSCKKELETANINPNNPESVSPEYLLNTSVFNTINFLGGKMSREIFAHYSNYASVGGGQFQRYSIYPSGNSSYWQTAYVSCLQPLHQIKLHHKDDPAYKNRVLIAEIFEAYVFSNIVAIWGSVPKSDALSGEVYVAYDKEEDIYHDLMETLKVAASSLDLKGDTYVGTADAVFAGDLLKWKKFANTLRLRLAVQIANADPSTAQKVVAEVMADESNTIMNAAETAKASWGTSSTDWSYLYDYNIVGASANASSLMTISESLVQHMLPYADPRLAVYAKPAATGPYKGKYWGEPKATQLPKGVNIAENPHSPLGKTDYSMFGDFFSKPDAQYVFISLEETNFLKAEIALKGWGGSKSAQQYYNDGIAASMAKYSISKAATDAYLAMPGVKWNSTVDTVGRQAEFADFIGITTSAIVEQDPFRQIVLQSWLAGFFNPMDAWTLIRRSQVLEFPPHFNPDGGEGGTVGYAYIPQRMLYPAVEYQVNSEALNKALAWLDGPDVFKTKLWFALPTKKNAFLPE